jgi:hypothetical protein
MLLVRRRNVPTVVLQEVQSINISSSSSRGAVQLGAKAAPGGPGWGTTGGMHMDGSQVGDASIHLTFVLTLSLGSDT